MKKVTLLSLIICFFCCAPDPSKPAKGFLEISLTLNQVKEIQPSYQTAIWLEKEDGRYVTSLYVSEYLSYGGYHDSTICTSWSKKSHWSAMPQSVFDQVTGATPELENRVFRFSCQAYAIPAGLYHFKVQTHLVEKYNVLYEGTIKIGGKQLEKIGRVSYIPSRHPQAGVDALSEVKARYVPRQR